MMVCQKIVREPMVGRKRTYNVVLPVDVEPDPKKPKIMGDASWNLVDCEKSERAAMIRSRFAETILKFQQKINHNQSNEADKKILKEKKANIEDKTRASNMELKIQRQKERQAARLSIDNIQRTVEWDNALRVTEEFERLIGVHTCPNINQFCRGRSSRT